VFTGYLGAEQAIKEDGGYETRCGGPKRGSESALMFSALFFLSVSAALICGTGAVSRYRKAEGSVQQALEKI
jgi:hypothetical protein